MSERKTAIASVLTLTGILASVQAAAEWRSLPPLPDAHGFASPFAGASNGVLLIAGGANFPGKPLWENGAKTWHDTIFAMRSTEEGWQRAGKLPAPRAYGLSVTTEQGVLCAGGSDAQRHSDEVFLLKWEDGRVVREELPPLPHPIALCAGARAGNLIYLAGGLESPESAEASDAFWVFDLKQPEKGWKSLSTWPGPARFQAVAAADDGCFYLFSGIGREKSANGTRTVYLKDAFRYSPEKGWVKLPDLPDAAAAAASPAPVRTDGIYVIGGVDGSGGNKSPEDFFHVPQRIQRYSPSERSWHPAGNAPVGRVCVSTAEWNGAWILPSGERSAGVRSPEVWSFK